jgi:hypothetical protein
LNTLIILAALLVSILSPLTAHISISPTGQMKYFVSLDVCNAPGTFSSADNANAPALHEGTCNPVPFKFAEFIEAYNSSFNPSFYFIAIDRPPKS